MSERRGNKRERSPEKNLEQELEILKKKFRKLEEQMMSNVSNEGNNNRDQVSDARASDRSSLDEGYKSSDAASSPKSLLEQHRQRNVLHAPPKYAKDSKVITSNNNTSSSPEYIKKIVPRNKDIILPNKRPSSPPTHNIIPEMAVRLDFVLQNGLSKQERFYLQEKYTIPNNCTLMKAPILNPEVIPFMHESAKKRDSVMFKYQDQLGAGMAAIAEGVTLASRSGSVGHRTAMEHIHRGLHLLADLHYDQTRVRRIVCTPVDSQLKSFLSAKQSHRNHDFQDINHLFKRDDTIFGRDIGKMIKEFFRQ